MCLRVLRACVLCAACAAPILHPVVVCVLCVLHVCCVWSVVGVCLRTLRFLCVEFLRLLGFPRTNQHKAMELFGIELVFIFLHSSHLLHT